MKKTILIDNRPFSFEEEILSLDTSPAITNEDAKKVLCLTKKLLEPIGLEFCLYWGTLLGAVRDKEVIKGDEDVDVYVTDEDKLYNSIPYLYDNGLKLVRFEKGSLYSFRANNNCYIDFYIVRPLRNSIWASTCYRITRYNQPKWIFKETEKISFLGEVFTCPKNPEKVLAFLYGDTWRTPMKGHIFPSEVKSAYYFHTFRNIIKKCIFYDQWYMYFKKSQ